MATDDIKVGLKVTLDEESIAREVEKAEGKLGKSKPSGPATSGQALVGIAERMRLAVTKPIVEKLEKIEKKLGGGEGSGASGGGLAMVKGIAAAIVIVEVLKAAYDALKAVLSAVWNLAQSLSRFSPVLAVAFRELQMVMRVLAIEMGATLGPSLAALVVEVTKIIVLLVNGLTPILLPLINLLKTLTVALNQIIRVVYLIAGMLLDLVSELAIFMQTWNTTAGFFVQAEFWRVVAEKADALGKGLQKAAISANDHSDAVSRMNEALIKGFSDISPVPATGRNASGDRSAPDFVPQVTVDSSGKVTRNAATSVSVATGRSSVPMTPPALANVVNNVQLNAEVKMQHEEAVQRAIEEVRGVLVRAIHGVRNEQLLLSSRIYARTVIDL